MSKCKKAKSCIYGSTMSGMEICDYIGKEGHSRGCPVKNCDKYKRKPRGSNEILEVAERRKQ